MLGSIVRESGLQVIIYSIPGKLGSLEDKGMIILIIMIIIKVA